MRRKIGALFVLAGLLTAVLILVIADYPSDHIIWIVAGCVLALAGAIMITYGNVNSRTENKSQESKNGEPKPFSIEEFKANARRIKVDFDFCEIKTERSSYEKEIDYYDRTEAWDGLYGKPPKSNFVDVVASYVLYKEDGDSDIVYSSMPWFGDIATLKFRLVLQKSTTIYVDREDPRRYYFDLEFLNSPHE